MMKTMIAYSSAVVLLVLVAAGPTAYAAHLSHQPAIPEKNGTYDDPGHPGVKVRVFVHPEKPTRTPSSALVCELPDPESEAVVGAAGWKLPAQWTFNLNPSSVPSSVGGSNLPTIAGNGFADWATAVNSKVTFNRGADTTATRQAYDGKNIVTWGRTNGSALGVTYIRYYTSTGQVVDVDTIMNKKFPWKWSNSNMCAESTAYDAENILTHELGHWVGMDDEYDTAYQHNTMYGYGDKGEVKKNTLTAGDVTGASIIYP